MSLKLHSANEPPTVGQLLQEELTRSSISVADLARRVNIRREFLSAVVNNRKPISHELAIEIASVLKLDPYLLPAVQTRRAIYDLMVRRVSKRSCQVSPR